MLGIESNSARPWQSLLTRTPSPTSPPQMGCKVEEVAAELLKQALGPGKANSARPVKKGAIKLPLFPSPETAPASRMGTAELLALEQETLHQEDLQRLGLSL